MRVRRVQALRIRPTVTVVVPCYNYGHYLPACVSSALSQEEVDVEVIIVDDCSPDGSAQVAKQLAADDARILVIEHAQNTGHIQTYNDGLGLAGGTYVVLLSADDLLTPGSLARSVALLEAHPEIGLVYGNPVTFETEPPTSRSRVPSWSTWRGETWIRRTCARGHNMIVCPEAVMRTSLLHQIGGYDARLPHSADMLMWMRAAARAGVGRVNGADQAYYRQHGGNMHVQSFGAFLTDLEERRRAMDIFFAADASRLRRPRALQTLAQRSLARDALAQGREYLDGGGRDLTVFESCRAIAAELGSHPRRSAYDLLDRRRAARAAGDRDPSTVQRACVFARSLGWKYRWQRWRHVGT